ncbi:MAG TPA: AAA family ATPase [Chthoniobacteraceae bacterium]|nr:AAA family ATPase [Chthoniobacteraceae bacterium]
MISEIRIQNFKSIVDLTLKPGRVTVLIGENGSGKSNILEGIAFAAAAAANKLDNEFLFNRGIRVAEWKWMQAAFPNEEAPEVSPRPSVFRLRDEALEYELRYEVQPMFWGKAGEFSEWSVAQPPQDEDIQAARSQVSADDRDAATDSIKRRFLEEIIDDAERKVIERIFASSREEIGVKLAAQRLRIARSTAVAERTGLRDYLIYAPENTVLRTPPPEGAIQPLGTKGEGLFRLLQLFSDEQFADRLAELKGRLRVFGWFEDFLAPDEAATMQARLQIRDRWLAPDRAVFDQRSANEGFLYVLFYLALLLSLRTPKFFALDNVDNALNPKLCSTLMHQIMELARKYDKQVVCTTHNPAVLDGLDLHDDEQRLYVVRRDSDGHTVLHRVRAPRPQPGETPVRLSEAFMRGIIGGLPDHF